MPLTQLERFQATMAREEHDGVLFYSKFIDDLAARVRADRSLAADADLLDHFGMFNPAMVGPKPPADHASPDFSAYFEDIDIRDDAFINSLGVLETPGSMYHFTSYTSPLRNASHFAELEGFAYPSVEGFTSDHMPAEVTAAHTAGRVANCWVGHMYEDSWQIRGYEEFLMDMHAQPEWCEFILDKVTERNLAVATAAARAGVDYLITGDDVANQNAMMFAPEQWRRFFKPRWAKVYAAARAIKPDLHIWYHSDGNIETIIPELIEIGVTILNPIQPECLDPVDIHRRYGDKVVLDGTLGTQTTMPFGSPDDVRAAVTGIIDAVGPTGGLIVSPTHVLEPEVPLQNIYAFVEAARDHRFVS